MHRRSRLFAWLIAAGICALIALTAQGLAGATRIGLEFRGGYELLFVATPAAPGGTVSPSDLLATAHELARRASASGIAEPEVRVESPAQIRLLLAGVEAGDQAQTLLQGPPLPVTLQVKWTHTVGGVLGAADFAATVKAGGVAFGAICLLLAVVYRTPAAFAIVGLSAYLWVVLGVFNALHATLSLAAIVAFVLGLGIAADANILIFERLREEHRHPGSERQIQWRALRAAGRTIVDASLATLIVALVLFAAGIGPIRGFALMTTVGVIASLACNLGLVGALHLLVTRDSDLRVAAEALPARTIDVLRAAPFVLVLVGALMAAGAWSIATRPPNYDIDFKAGTALDIDLAGQSITKEEATDVMAGSGISAATVAIGGTTQSHVEARFDNALPPEKIARIVDQFKTAYGDKAAYQENTADPAVARDLVRQALIAVALALVALAALVTWRFGWRFAVATMSCVVVSCCLVVAVFSLFHLEIDVTFIAAILTVMGYAVNDSVVTFDRIRDNARVLRWSSRRWGKRATDCGFRRPIGAQSKRRRPMHRVIGREMRRYRGGSSSLRLGARTLQSAGHLGGGARGRHDTFNCRFRSQHCDAHIDGGRNGRVGREGPTDIDHPCIRHNRLDQRRRPRCGGQGGRSGGNAGANGSRDAGSKAECHHHTSTAAKSRSAREGRGRRRVPGRESQGSAGQKAVDDRGEGLKARRRMLSLAVAPRRIRSSADAMCSRHSHGRGRPADQ